ncbi:MAG: hypothetical protein AUJ06_00215 [Chloroflexi bacterium 13_1_40CM_3_70_6]|nr:MAG: hypothetical protein AUJ06_00215 [Chloroflexi bacterium 13_1_40CM_3_70_6]
MAWLFLPFVRAYQLVAARHGDPHAPADLVLEDASWTVGGRAAAGWLLRGSAGAPAIVLVHGFKTSREEMVPWARFLHDASFNVLLFDTRGAGRSAGEVIGLGATERLDVAAAATAAKESFGTSRVGVLGISLGAGAAILAAADDPEIGAVVADSAWTDQDFQLSRLSFISLGPARVPLPPYGVAAVNAMVGADVARARPGEAIARIAPRPVLLIHSADDDNATTPVAGARALYAAAGEPKELWIAPRGGHVGAIGAFPDEYRARVLAFLGRAFG